MKKLLSAMLLLSAAYGCDKEPECTAPGPAPVIEAVYDHSGEVTCAQRGATVEIVGSHLATVGSVRFNGIEADLRTAEISADKILVVIPLDAPIISERAVDDELEVTGDGGIFACDFVLLPAPPKITMISNRAPQPGEELTIWGTGFFYVQSVTFPSQTPIEVTEFDLYPDGTALTVAVPVGYDPAEGYIFVNTLSGSHSIRPDDPSGNRLDILNLRYIDTSHGAAPWQVRYNLQPGDRAYVDREYTISVVPEDLKGATWISTATNSRVFNTPGETLAAFDINRPADVYIARNRAGGNTVEEWLVDWEALPQNVANSIVLPSGGSNPDDVFYLYRKNFPQGTVNVGRNGMTNRAPYIVIVK